jgi:hypothetical protein
MSRLKFPAEFNIVPSGVAVAHVTLFESKQPDWLDGNYYNFSDIMVAVCCRMADKGINPHNHTAALIELRRTVHSMKQCETIRVNIGGLTVIVYHMDGKRAPKLELVAY